MRARNIKPGFFKNELLGTSDPITALLFEGLWLLSDRDGRLEDRPLRIKAEIFPYREDLNIHGSLTELERMGFICRYVVNELAVIQILNFRKHQTPHKTEKAGTLPAMVCKPLENIMTSSGTDKPPKEACAITETLPPDSSFPDSLIPDSPNPDSITASAEQEAAKAAPPDPIVLVIRAFDDARAAVFGESLRREIAAADDRVFAERFLAAGAPLDWLKDFFLERMAKRKAAGEDAPAGLRYFQKAVPEALKRFMDAKSAPQAKIFQPKPEAIERTPEDQAKYDAEQRKWHRKMGMQHSTYNPEGIREDVA